MGPVGPVGPDRVHGAAVLPLGVKVLNFSQNFDYVLVRNRSILNKIHVIGFMGPWGPDCPLLSIGAPSGGMIF